MHKLLKGVLFCSTLLSLNSVNAQEMIPPEPPLPPGMTYDTLKRADADGWEFVQMQMPNTHIVHEEGSYHNGVMQGEWVTYWQTQMPRSVTYYYNGKMNGLHMIMDMQGSLVLLEHYRNGLLDGPSRVYEPHTGALLEETYYSNGVKHGNHEKFYLGRAPEEKDRYNHGTLDGPAVWYYDNGEKSVEYSYSNGMLNGTATTYFKNGRISEVGHYKDNYPDGDWKEFYENGNLKCEGKYDKDGDKDGAWKMYDENGKYDKTVHYRKGELKK